MITYRPPGRIRPVSHPPRQACRGSSPASPRRYNGRMRDPDLLQLSPEDLVRAAAERGVRLRVLPDRDALYADFAEALIAEVRRAWAEDRPCRLIVPVG